MAKDKVVLAYSGGLDTTAIIPWLKETYDYDVICACIDVGQESELEGLDERAKYSGASKLYILDVVDELCDEYIMPTVQADAVYENKYLLGTSFARPLIAKKLVEVARKEGAVAICHGATGKGNDQLRLSFQLRLLLLTSRLSLYGDSRNGSWIPGMRRSHTVRHMVLIFHLMLLILTAVTVISGTSAMKVWNWRILQTNQTTMIFWFSVLPLKRHRMRMNI